VTYGAGATRTALCSVMAASALSGIQQTELSFLSGQSSGWGVRCLPQIFCSVPSQYPISIRPVTSAVSAERLSALLTGLSCPQDPDAFSIACREPGLVRIECIARRDGCRHMLRVDPDQPCNRITYSAQKVSGLF
jgi:hypothetical protein